MIQILVLHLLHVRARQSNDEKKKKKKRKEKKKVGGGDTIGSNSLGRASQR